MKRRASGVRNRNTPLAQKVFGLFNFIILNLGLTNLLKIVRLLKHLVFLRVQRNPFYMRLEDLKVGQSVEREDIVTEEIVNAFAAISRDYNPIHVNEEYASATIFGGRIAHGAFLGAGFSGLIGMELPGPGAMVTSLNMKFRGGVRLGTQVTTRVAIKRVDTRRGFLTMNCLCTVAGKPVVKGQATIMMLVRPVD